MKGLKVISFYLPQEGVGLLEVGTDSDQLMDKVFDSSDSELAEVLFDDVVVVNGESLSVNLGETSLVDQISHQFSCGIAEQYYLS